MSTRRNRLVVPALLIGAIVVVALNTWLAYSALRTLEFSQFWVDHTWEVLNQVEHSADRHAKDAESSARGYVNAATWRCWSTHRGQGATRQGR